MHLLLSATLRRCPSEEPTIHERTYAIVLQKVYCGKSYATEPVDSAIRLKIPATIPNLRFVLFLSLHELLLIHMV